VSRILYRLEIEAAADAGMQVLLVDRESAKMQNGIPARQYLLSIKKCSARLDLDVRPD
jgi:hypothetical protein